MIPRRGKLSLFALVDVELEGSEEPEEVPDVVPVVVPPLAGGGTIVVPPLEPEVEPVVVPLLEPEVEPVADPLPVPDVVAQVLVADVPVAVPVALSRPGVCRSGRCRRIGPRITATATGQCNRYATQQCRPDNPTRPESPLGFPHAFPKKRLQCRPGRTKSLIQGGAREGTATLGRRLILRGRRQRVPRQPRHRPFVPLDRKLCVPGFHRVCS